MLQQQQTLSAEFAQRCIILFRYLRKNSNIPFFWLYFMQNNFIRIAGGVLVVASQWLLVDVHVVCEEFCSRARMGKRRTMDRRIRLDGQTNSEPLLRGKWQVTSFRQSNWSPFCFVILQNNFLVLIALSPICFIPTASGCPGCCIDCFGKGPVTVRVPEALDKDELAIQPAACWSIAISCTWRSCF